jgi:hypothetical protein
MTNTRIATAKVMLAVTLAALTAACGKKDDAAVAVDTTGMVNPPAAATALRVSEIETGKKLEADKSIGDGTDDFGVRDTIYVAVKTEGSGSGTLAAKWMYQDGQTVDQNTQSISPTGDAWHEFHVQKATAWPAGKYKVEVTLDGAPAGTKDFEIK